MNDGPADLLREELKKRANERQVDGGHYVKYGEIQPWDTWIPWNLNGFQCEVLKLVVRYRDKNGVKDLQKAIHYLEKLIEIENGRRSA
jgi:hypothetical protein